MSRVTQTYEVLPNGSVEYRHTASVGSMAFAATEIVEHRSDTPMVYVDARLRRRLIAGIESYLYGERE